MKKKKLNQFLINSLDLHMEPVFLVYHRLFSTINAIRLPFALMCLGVEIILACIERMDDIAGTADSLVKDGGACVLYTVQISSGN